MAATLREMLLAPDTQPNVMADCKTLVEQELADKSGVAAGALKLGYKTVTSFAPGYFQETLEFMVPPMVDKLEPFWADFKASGGAEFGDYLTKRGEEVSEALLSVTDGMAELSDRAVVVKAYRTVRGGALKHVAAALPRLGAMVLKYAA